MSDTALDPEFRAVQAEAAIAEANRRLLAQEVASDLGLPLRHAGRLHGVTREELEADAAEFIATMDELMPAQPRTNANAGDEGLGARPDTMGGRLREAFLRREWTT